jgi:hypothetical protein
MSRETFQEKARRYLVEGRVRILACDEEDGTAQGEVRGHGAIYTVSHDETGWECDCLARTECAHIAAIKCVTVLKPRELRP